MTVQKNVELIGELKMPVHRMNIEFENGSPMNHNTPESKVMVARITRISVSELKLGDIVQKWGKDGHTYHVISSITSYLAKS